MRQHSDRRLEGEEGLGRIEIVLVEDLDLEVRRVRQGMEIGPRQRMLAHASSTC